MAKSATSRLIAQRLLLLEEYLKCLEAADGHSIDDWQRWAQEARRSGRRSTLRKQFKERCRDAKRRWLPLRDFVTKNLRVIRLMEDETLRYGGAVFSESVQMHSGHFVPGDVHTVLSIVRRCWILGSECVEPAREGVLMLLDKQRQREPMGAIMDAVQSATAAERRNPKLFNQDGTMKGPVHRILKVLASPCIKLTGIQKAGKFETEQAVKDVTGAMRREGWIVRKPGNRWVRTKKGAEEFAKAENVGET